MSLLGSLHTAKSALVATQVGLQVTGNNIANANTPGYTRQRVSFTPAPTQILGDLPIGTGVEVEAILRESDRFLAERLRGAVSDLSNSATQEQGYLELEALLGELGENDLSTSLSNFFGAINNVLNQPEDPTVRRLIGVEAQALADDVRRLNRGAQQLRHEVNERVVASVEEINRLIGEVAELNTKIVTGELGGLSNSDAGGLRDQRDVALSRLSELISIKVSEQENGAVAVFAGGDFLVFDNQHRDVTVDFVTDRGLQIATLHIVDTDSPLTVSGGSIAGLYATRDEILGGFLDELDEFIGTFTYEFNRVYASGQGLTGFSELTGEYEAQDAAAALDQAGLPFVPVHGSFQVVVENTRTGELTTTDVFVQLNGLDDDTSLDDLAASLNAIDGLTADVSPDRRLRLSSDTSDHEFSFRNDTSGALAALGLNVLFTGSTAADLGVSSVVRDDPSRIAVSRGGVANDSQNFAILAGFADEPLAAYDGHSLREAYEVMVAGVVQGSAATRAVTEGLRVFQQTVEGQHLGLTGVSVDDEAINMIALQRSYQAAARYISTINELLATLVSI